MLVISTSNMNIKLEITTIYYPMSNASILCVVFYVYIMAFQCPFEATWPPAATWSSPTCPMALPPSPRCLPRAGCSGWPSAVATSSAWTPPWTPRSPATTARASSGLWAEQRRRWSVGWCWKPDGYATGTCWVGGDWTRWLDVPKCDKWQFFLPQSIGPVMRWSKTRWITLW